MSKPKTISEIAIPITTIVAVVMAICTGMWHYSRLEARVANIEKTKESITSSVEEDHKFREQVLLKLARIEGKLSIENKTQWGH